MRLRVVLFLALFLSLASAENTGVDTVSAQASEIPSNAEYERMLIESESSLRDARTNADILDDLFTPIVAQAKELERQLDRAERFQRAEYILLLLLGSTILILVYLGYSYANLKKRSFQIEKLERNVNKVLGEILPSTVVDRVILDGEVDPSIWQDCLVAFLVFEHTRPYKNAEHRMKIMGQVFDVVDRNFEEFGLLRIKASGPTVLSAHKINRVTPQQQLQRTTACVHQIKQEIKGIEKGLIAVRAGMDYGDVISGLIGKDELRFDIWGRAVNRAARLSRTASNDQVLVGAEIAKIAPSARIDCRLVGMENSENKQDELEMFELV